MTKESTRFFGLTQKLGENFIYRHILNREVQLHVPRKESYPIPLSYIDVTRSTYADLEIAKKRSYDYWDVDKNGNLCSKITRAEVSEAKIHLYWYCMEKKEILCFITTWDTYSCHWKDLKESSSPTFLISKVKASACCLVWRRDVSVGQNSSSNPTTRGVRDTLKCELGNSECCSDQRISGAHECECGRCTHK